MNRHRRGLTIVGLTQRTPTTSYGGAPVVVLNLARYCLGLGIDVQLLLFTGPKVREARFAIPAGVQLARVRLGAFPLMLVAVLRALSQRPADAILSLGNKGNALAAAASSLLGRRDQFWPSLHHDLATEIAGWTPGRQQRRLKQWRRWVEGSGGLITVSRGLAESCCALTGMPAARVQTIYNPIVDDSLAADELAAEDRQPSPHPWLSERRPVVMGVGRLTAQKDFGTLLEAFALLRAQRQEVRLMILGEGEEHDRLLAKTAALGLGDDCQWVGFQPEPLRWMRGAAVFALSSRWEGFGNVLVEALHSGVPVVSTDCPHGPREILDAGRYGRLVPLGNPEALASALAATLDHPPAQQALRQRAAAFSISRSGEQYVRLLGLTSLK